VRLKKKFDKALSTIKAVEGQYTERCKSGSKDMNDYLEMSYYSGLHNGFKFVWYIIDHMDSVNEKDFDEMLDKVLHIKPMKVN